MCAVSELGLDLGMSEVFSNHNDPVIPLGQHKAMTSSGFVQENQRKKFITFLYKISPISYIGK